jgi:predicted patatin/cPLA2 family phospholipase
MGRVVLYLAGGAMTGVFSAGVLKRLHEIHFHDQVDAVYAVSAGALNGAYFLAGQAPMLETIYTQELSRKDFVQTAKLLTRSNVIDLDYLFGTVAEKHKLDLDTFRNQPVPLFAKVLNVQTDAIEYLDARDFGVFPVLQATSCIVPFYKKAIQINNQSYIDGGIKEAIGLANVRANHPEAMIVVVVNRPFRTGMNRVLSNLWRSAVLYAACDKHLYDLFTQSHSFEELELREALAQQNIFVVYPPVDFPVSYATTDAKLLKRGYDIGYETARFIVPYIEKQSIPLPLAESRTLSAALQQVASAAPAAVLSV